MFLLLLLQSEDRGGVDMPGPFTRLDLEMQMVPARAAGRATVPERLSGVNLLARLDAETTQVRVRRDVVVVSDLDEIAVRSAVPAIDDGAALDRVDRVGRGATEVDTGVVIPLSEDDAPPETRCHVERDGERGT